MGYNIRKHIFVGRAKRDRPLGHGATFRWSCFTTAYFRSGQRQHGQLGSRFRPQDGRQAQAIVGSSILLISLTSICLAWLGITWGDSIFIRLGARGETLEQVRAYMNVWFAGSIAAALSREGNKILIAAGSPRVSSSMTVIGMLLNVILDPIFIFGWGFVPGMGIKGAAIATVISQSLSSFVILIIPSASSCLRQAHSAPPGSGRVEV